MFLRKDFKKTIELLKLHRKNFFRIMSILLNSIGTMEEKNEKLSNPQ